MEDKTSLKNEKVEKNNTKVTKKNMTEEEKETQSPKPEEDKTSENKPEEEKPEVLGEGTEGTSEPEGEKTSEQIESLQAQKEHWREKAQKAEGELIELKEKFSTPSDKELTQKYPDWEYKEEDEKQRLRKEEERERRLRKLEEQVAWDRDYAHILEKFPQLKEREVEFKEFAYKKENRGTPLEVLAKSFLYEEKVPEPKKEPETPKKGLEKPTGGDKAPGTEMSLADIERLRTTDFNKYIKLVKEGRIPKNIPKK